MKYDLTAPFVPCAIYLPEQNATEVVLADVPTVWLHAPSVVECGYDMDSGALVAVRMRGDVTKRNG